MTFSSIPQNSLPGFAPASSSEQAGGLFAPGGSPIEGGGDSGEELLDFLLVLGESVLAFQQPQAKTSGDQAAPGFSLGGESGAKAGENGKPSAFGPKHSAAAKRTPAPLEAISLPQGKGIRVAQPSRPIPTGGPAISGAATSGQATPGPQLSSPATSDPTAIAPSVSTEPAKTESLVQQFDLKSLGIKIAEALVARTAPGAIPAADLSLMTNLSPIAAPTNDGRGPAAAIETAAGESGAGAGAKAPSGLAEFILAPESAPVASAVNTLPSPPASPLASATPDLQSTVALFEEALAVTQRPGGPAPEGATPNTTSISTSISNSTSTPPSPALTTPTPLSSAEGAPTTPATPAGPETTIVAPSVSDPAASPAPATAPETLPTVGDSIRQAAPADPSVAAPTPATTSAAEEGSLAKPAPTAAPPTATDTEVDEPAKPAEPKTDAGKEAGRSAANRNDGARRGREFDLSQPALQHAADSALRHASKRSVLDLARAAAGTGPAPEAEAPTPPPNTVRTQEPALAPPTAPAPDVAETAKPLPRISTAPASTPEKSSAPEPPAAAEELIRRTPAASEPQSDLKQVDRLRDLVSRIRQMPMDGPGPRIGSLGEVQSPTVVAPAPAPGTAPPASLAWTSPAYAASAPPVDGYTLVQQVREVADFLASNLEGSVRVGPKSVDAQLRLYPPDLGRVRVEMSVSNTKSVEVRFVVEQAETGRLLNQNLQQFTQALARQGFNVERVTVSLEPRSIREAGANDEFASGSREDGTSRGRQQNETQGFKREGSHRQDAWSAWENLVA